MARLDLTFLDIPPAFPPQLHKARRDLDGKAVDYEATMAFKTAFVKKVGGGWSERKVGPCSTPCLPCTAGCLPCTCGTVRNTSTPVCGCRTSSTGDGDGKAYGFDVGGLRATPARANSCVCLYPSSRTSVCPQVYDRYGKSTLSSPQYQAWFEENAFWLRPYAAFCLLRDIFGVRKQQGT